MLQKCEKYLSKSITELTFDETSELLNECEQCPHYYHCDTAGKFNKHLAFLDGSTDEDEVE